MQRILAEVRREVFRNTPQVKFFKCLPSKRQEIVTMATNTIGEAGLPKLRKFETWMKHQCNMVLGCFGICSLGAVSFLFGASVVALGVGGCCKGTVATQTRLALRGGRWGGAGMCGRMRGYVGRCQGGPAPRY